MPAYFRLFLAIMLVIGSLIAGSLAGANIAAAQTPDSGMAAKKSMKDSAAERRNAIEEKKRLRQERLNEVEKKDIEAMEARKRKKTECGKQAKQQNLHLLKRRSFMKKCMAG